MFCVFNNFVKSTNEFYINKTFKQNDLIIKM